MAELDYKSAAEQLERDMRRYLYDHQPDRRIQCLTRYRERLGLPSWAEEEDARLKAALAEYEVKDA